MSRSLRCARRPVRVVAPVEVGGFTDRAGERKLGAMNVPTRLRALLLPASLLGCGGTAPPATVTQQPSYDLYAPDRLGCRFGPGDTTVTTVGPDVPRGDALPFDHVVVLMMENRSFDHYFSRLPAVGVTDVDVATDADFNPDPTPPLTLVHRFHETRYCVEDVVHDWAAVHLQWNDGAMDGFVTTNNPGGARAMGYYTEVDLPYYYWLAQTFAISDRHFCSLLGPTWPNRFFFYGATSWGRTRTPDLPPIGALEILDRMDAAGRSFKIYRDGLTSFAIALEPLAYVGSPMSDFDADVASGNVPHLSIIDPNFLGSGQNDEHPPTNMQLGQEFSAHVISTLMSNPSVWQRTVLFITYDEHGGFYDHVPPPPACEPDDQRPPDWAFDRLGVRIPLIVVSPFAKTGYVSHIVSDLTSVTRFIENRFELGAMTRRDANAWPLLDMFDFDNAPFWTPPAGAPSAAPSPEGIGWCASNPPGTGLP